MASITEQQLTELENLWATIPGVEWKASWSMVFTEVESQDMPLILVGNADCIYPIKEHRQLVLQFIAKAHNCLPDLIAEIRTLRGHLNPSARQPE